MALNDLERKRLEKTVGAFIEKRRPPPSVRPELDFGFRISGQSVELFEIRPQWDDPSQRTERPVAKATFVRTQQLWKIFWMRADLKWHGYRPNAEVAQVEDFLAVVARDEYGCFWG
jgi:hypothetical protein